MMQQQQESEKRPRSAALWNVALEFAWLVSATYIVDICPYPPVTTAASLVTSSSIVAATGCLLHSACCTSYAALRSFVLMLLLSVSALMVFVGLCKLGGGPHACKKLIHCYTSSSENVLKLALRLDYCIANTHPKNKM